MKPTVSPWKRFFYFSHIFSCLAAVGNVLCAWFAERAEESTIGRFNLRLTSVPALINYLSAGFLGIMALIGYLAQRLTNKPSLWILYCILMSILTLVELAVAVGVLGKVGNHKTTQNTLRHQMEEYIKEGIEAADRWDQLHIQYKCCGVESYKEWQDVQYGRTSLRVPKSCCLPPNNEDSYCSLNVLPEHDEADKIIYTRGCLAPVIKQVDFHMTVLGLFGLTVSLILLALVSLSCFLVITKKV